MAGSQHGHRDGWQAGDLHDRHSDFRWRVRWDRRGGGIPAGGGGGAGGMPLLTWMVMIDPGTVCPAGEVPTTAPAGELLLTGVACSATWKPASFSR